MPLVSKPYNYNNGQTIDATQLDQNLDTLYNLINGLLDAVNIAAAGLNDPNKFAAEVITQAKSKGLVYTQDLYGQSWVVSGGVTTASGSPANQITVTTLIANILQADGSYRHVSVAGTTYVTSIINATYFLELQPDGTMNWSQTHSVQSGYMPIATVTSNASGNINVITDQRVTGLMLRTPVKTPNNTLDDGTGLATFTGTNNGQVSIVAGGVNGNASVQLKALGTGAPFTSLQSVGVEQWQFGSDTGNAGRYYLYSSSIAANGGMALTLDKTTGNVNIVGALTAGAGGSFAITKATSGNQKLPGGFTKQWGVATIPTGAGGTTVTFPTPFPTDCFGVQLTINAGSTGITASVYSKTASSMIIAQSSASSVVIFWEALGW